MSCVHYFNSTHSMHGVIASLHRIPEESQNDDWNCVLIFLVRVVLRGAAQRRRTGSAPWPVRIKSRFRPQRPPPMSSHDAMLGSLPHHLVLVLVFVALLHDWLKMTIWTRPVPAAPPIILVSTQTQPARTPWLLVFSTCLAAITSWSTLFAAFGVSKTTIGSQPALIGTNTSCVLSPACSRMRSLAQKPRGALFLSRLSHSGAPCAHRPSWSEETQDLRLPLPRVPLALVFDGCLAGLAAADEGSWNSCSTNPACTDVGCDCCCGVSCTSAASCAEHSSFQSPGRRL